MRLSLAARPDYSWRRDPSVPKFPDDRPLIVFDGVCVLCSGFARFVASRDAANLYRFTAAQSPLGQGLFTHFGLDPVNYESNLLIADGRAFAKMQAFARIMGGLGLPWRLLAAVESLPVAMADGFYDRIARNRYRLFGRRETCVVPGADWAGRVIG